jgi:glucuronoarabinoxylan endo-1,4-beta-xylanase
MPESLRYDQSYSDPTLNDPVAVANVDIIGGHLYGNGDAGETIVDYPNAHNKGKPTWMTEFLVNDQTIGTAITTAKQIHDCLTVGNMSAYIWWKCLGDANGLVNASGVPQKRGFVMAQWSRFVRPGFYRVGASVAGGTLLVSAFQETNYMNFAIVAINTNANVDVVQTFSLTNFPATGFVTPWITSRDYSLSSLPPVTVTNSSFTYTIPFQSVVTFVGQATTNAPAAVPPPAPEQPMFTSISVSGGSGGQITLALTGPAGKTYTLLTSTNLVTWQPLYTTNSPTMPINLAFPHHTSDGMRFYRIETDVAQ